MADRVHPTPEARETLRHAVYETLGAASMCWDPRPEGVFESERASALGSSLLALIESVTHMGEPNLGLATTREIIDEYRARAESGHLDPDYRVLEPGEPLWHLVIEEWVGKEEIWQHRDYPSIYSTDRGKTFYNLDLPVDSDGNPHIYETGNYIA